MRIFLTCIVLSVGGVFALLSALWIDRPVAIFFEEAVYGQYRVVFEWITDIGRAEFLLAIALAAGFFFWWRLRKNKGKDEIARYWVQTVVFILASVVVSGILVQALKFVFGRYRPQMYLTEGLYGLAPFSGANSFPSGHTQSIVAALLPLALCWPATRWITIFIMILVAFSRVVLTAHFVSDVVFSIIFTSVCVVWLQIYLRRAGFFARML